MGDAHDGARAVRELEAAWSTSLGTLFPAFLKTRNIGFGGGMVVMPCLNFEYRLIPALQGLVSELSTVPHPD